MLPDGYLALTAMQMISRKLRLNVLTMLYQNACLLVLSFPGSFINKNAITHKTKSISAVVSSTPEILENFAKKM